LSPTCYNIPSLQPSNRTQKSVNDLYKLPFVNIVFFCIACKLVGSSMLFHEMVIASGGELLSSTVFFCCLFN